MTDTLWGSLSDLARASGLTDRALRRIKAREPALLPTRRRGGRAEYHIGRCNAALRERERRLAEQHAGRTADPTITELERRKAAADARYAEVRVDLLERDLVRVDDYLAETEDLLAHVRSLLLANPKTRAVAPAILEELRQRPPVEVES